MGSRFTGRSLWERGPLVRAQGVSMSQQQQQDEERRRQEEGCTCPSWWGCERWGCYEEAKHAYGQQKEADIIDRYDSSGDMAPDGRNIAYWNRRIIGPQIEMNSAISERSRGRKR